MKAICLSFILHPSAFILLFGGLLSLLADLLVLPNGFRIGLDVHLFAQQDAVFPIGGERGRRVALAARTRIKARRLVSRSASIPSARRSNRSASG